MNKITKILEYTTIGTVSGFAIGTFYNSLDHFISKRYNEKFLPYITTTGAAFGTVLGICEVQPIIGFPIIAGSMIGVNLFYYNENKRFDNWFKNKIIQ